ncbi:MAG: hypothetical protein ABJ358_07920, partial [Rhizobiaceae bacterium]
MATEPTNNPNSKTPASKQVVDETWNLDSGEQSKLDDDAHDFLLAESLGSTEGHLANAHMGGESRTEPAAQAAETTGNVDTPADRSNSEGSVDNN